MCFELIVNDKDSSDIQTIVIIINPDKYFLLFFIFRYVFFLQLVQSKEHFGAKDKLLASQILISLFFIFYSHCSLLL